MESGFLVGVHLCTTQVLCVSSMNGVLQTHSCARCVGSTQSSDELFLCLYTRTAFCHPSFYTISSLTVPWDIVTQVGSQKSNLVLVLFHVSDTALILLPLPQIYVNLLPFQGACFLPSVEKIGRGEGVEISNVVIFMVLQTNTLKFHN